APRLRIVAMARAAAEIGEALAAGFGEGAAAAAAEPCLERARLHDHDAADHLRVLRAAILGAEEVEGPELRGFEPERGVPAGEDVLLDTKGRHVKAMDDVLRGHYEPHRLAEGDVELVDLALAAEVLRLPHPALADHVDRERVGRRLDHRGVHFRAPIEDAEE